MKNKRGFTLIEVIAVIVILGLIVLIALPFFQGSLSTFREDYYDELEKNSLNSGKEFFKENKLFLPNRFLDTQKVDYATLVNQGFFEEVKDYNGKKCDNKNSYIIAVKTGVDKYDYASCTKCEEDDYENTKSIYCSEAWDNDKGFTEVVFDAPPDVYVYKGTTREQLKEKVVVYPDIRRCLGVGTCVKEVTRVSAKGEAGVNPIYPKDIDKVDTSKIGTYEVTYVYDLNDKDADGNLKEKTGRVIVYGYDMKPYDPNADDNDNDIVFTKYNTVYKEDDSNSVVSKQTEVITSRYNPANSNDWAQKLNIKFNYHGEVNGEKVLVARYQWFINGRWEDYCVPNRETNKQNNSCDTTIGNVSGGFELNDDMRFRFIDVNGKVSEESTYKIRIDYTAPDTCSLELSGTMGTRTEEAKTWYVSPKVVISFASKDDATKTSGHSGGVVKSGINYYGLTKSARVQNEFGEQTGDTTGVTWYGYIEDKAQNFTVCQINFKKDSTVPECTKRGDNKTWKNTKVTVYWGCKDDTSKCVTAEAHKDFETDDTYQKTWTAAAYDIYDKAGNHTLCDEKTRNIYFDKKEPTCTSGGDNSKWKNSAVTITWGCNDGTGQSGCDPNNSGGSHKYSTSTKTASITAYTIKDNAGNSQSCDARVANVYVDVDKPTCTASKTAGVGTTGGVTISVSCSDTGGSDIPTGNCPSGGSSLTTGTYTYKVKDAAGNEGSCSNSVTDKKCGCKDCYTGENTCQPGNVSDGEDCSHDTGGYNESQTFDWGYVSCSQCYSPGSGTCPFTGWDCTVCKYKYKYSTCATGHNTCKPGCDTCYE